MTNIRNVRGTVDLLNEAAKMHENVINRATEISENYCYDRIFTPIIEYAEIFDRSLGKTSDVISKEIYVFQDKSEGILALRPEFTASIVRAYIANGWKHLLPLKLFSYGPVFRYDRPQAGRQRQFHQLNFEHLGANKSFDDAEILKLSDHLTEILGIKKDVTLEINSLGCFESRAKYSQILFEYFSKFKNSLSKESVKRITTNPLRILDSKNSTDKEIIFEAPRIKDSYTKYAKQYFEDVQNYLAKFGVTYKLNEFLVRGLDYYCHTAFEFTTNKLGSQNAIIAGGRYDKLATMLGGPQTNAIGFAAGIERIILLNKLQNTIIRKTIILPLDEDAMEESIKLLSLLRENNISTIIEFDGSISKKLKKANKLNAKYAIFIGIDEIKNNIYKIKNLDTGIEILLSNSGISNLLNHLKS